MAGKSKSSAGNRTGPTTSPLDLEVRAAEIGQGELAEIVRRLALWDKAAGQRATAISPAEYTQLHSIRDQVITLITRHRPAEDVAL